ncbi:MAG: type II toxin-antitoxin system RelE/ParE family toxin [Motiliproteus sp.]
MSEGAASKIDVYETNRFTKALERLSESALQGVEDEIERIIEDPTIGEQKKGDLNYMRVHKFKVDSGLVLLGYSWVEQKLELYLLSIGSHENFYREAKTTRKADLKLMK